MLTKTGQPSDAPPADDAGPDGAPDEPSRDVLQVAAPARGRPHAPVERRQEVGRGDVSARAGGQGAAPRPAPDADDEDDGATRRPSRFRHFLVSLGRTLATVLILGLAILAGLLIWNYYVTAPWTRDGRVRVQVAAVAPQVSGQITELRVRDNQFVRKGDVLYVIDTFDFKRTLETSKATLRMRAADLQVKKVQAQRRQSLSNLATTPEEQQIYVGSATQAQAAFDSAQQDVAQATINLQRTSVQSPVNGFITNLLMRVGDYAREGTSNISVIDSDSFWIDGYFEETKMAHVCLGDRAEAQLMGYRRPIVGIVETVTRGISVSNAAPSTQGLPDVDPVYTWVRLAQRVPVRIRITEVPPGVPLVSGMTTTVTIRGKDAAAAPEPWYRQRWDTLANTVIELASRPQARERCIPPVGTDKGVTDRIQGYRMPPVRSADEVAPGLAPGMTQQPAVVP